MMTNKIEKLCRTQQIMVSKCMVLLPSHRTRLVHFQCDQDVFVLLIKSLPNQLHGQLASIRGKQICLRRDTAASGDTSRKCPIQDFLLEEILVVISIHRREVLCVLLQDTKTLKFMQ